MRYYKPISFALMFLILAVLALCFAPRCTTPLSTAIDNKSENCLKISDTTAYYKISGILYTADAVNFWQDIQNLKATDVRIIEIYLDSPGGDPYTGFSYVDIIERAKEDGFTVNIRAYGHVMSAVVPIIVAGSHRSCGKHTNFMMHKPYLPELTPFGYPEEVWEFIKQSLNSVFETYAKIIADYTKLSVQEAEEMLIVKGVYFNAYEALEMGFIDEII